MITSQIMKLLLDKYEDFILESTYLNESGVRIYVLSFDDETKVECKVCYGDFARLVEIE